MKTVEIEPVISSDKPTLLVHNVLINCGYVESARHATVICQHRFGFSEPEQVLLHLHKVLKEAWLTAEEEHDRYARSLGNKNANNFSNWRKALEDAQHPEHQEVNEAFSQWIGE